jgi:hypothetical protein
MLQSLIKVPAVVALQTSTSTGCQEGTSTLPPLALHSTDHRCSSSSRPIHASRPDLDRAIHGRGDQAFALWVHGHAANHVRVGLHGKRGRGEGPGGRAGGPHACQTSALHWSAKGAIHAACASFTRSLRVPGHAPPTTHAWAHMPRTAAHYSAQLQQPTLVDSKTKRTMKVRLHEYMEVSKLQECSSCRCSGT